jgi:hypothetical protein
MNRRLRTGLPISKHLLAPQIPNDVNKYATRNQEIPKLYHDRNRSEGQTKSADRELRANEKVCVDDRKKKDWEVGMAGGIAGTPRSYLAKVSQNEVCAERATTFESVK